MHDGAVMPRLFKMFLPVIAFAVCALGTPPIRLVDGHTAGTLPKGMYDIESRIFPGGNTTNGSGLLFGFSYGVTGRLTLGLSYGGDGFIGRSTGISLNHYPGFLAKFRFVDENFFLPAMSLGFDYQGYGGIATEEQFGYTGYIYKSEGFFFVVSKSYLLFRKIELGFHWDIHMSTEEWSENKALNMITGADLGISDHVSFLFEYNLGLNTKDPYGGANSAVRPLDGYLHAGLRWNFNPNFIVEFNGRDLLENRKRGTVDPGQKVGWSRELKLIYRSDI